MPAFATNPIGGCMADDTSDFQALKHALELYAQARAGLPPSHRRAVASELGDLLVTVVGVADRLEVDLVTAAEEHVARRAASRPRGVQRKR
jgi:NTP pyrophosphatase (non-canonical NTP hydrolase)